MRKGKGKKEKKIDKTKIYGYEEKGTKLVLMKRGETLEDTLKFFS